MSASGDRADPILVVGSVALDTVSTPYGRVEEVLGGAASYAGVAASYFAPVRLVGAVGEDFPEECRRLLAGRGIDLEGLQKAAGRTFRWGGRYDSDLNRVETLFTELNVFEGFRPRIPAAYRSSPVVFLANIDPELQLAVLEQVERPRLALADTMDFWIRSKRSEVLRVLSRVQVALMNESEARLLCETPSLVTAGKRLLEVGPEAAIIKKGEHGALMFTPGSVFSAPSYPLEEVRDPTGAGDSFAGGLAGHLAGVGRIDEEELRRGVIFGSVLASFNVEDFSLCRLATLSREEILERGRAFAELVRFRLE
jgi:sugar/nucleoside kinase (ribokinase family)